MTATSRIATLVLVAALSTPADAQTIPSPSEHLGLAIGSDRVLADYGQIESYFRMLGERSDRVVIEDLGPTTMGETMIMAVISSGENIRNRDRLREISARLADPRGASPGELDAMIAEGRPVVLVTCNIHSTEVGSSQMAMEWAHALATATDDETLQRLDDVVLLLVPSLNPDGQTMVVDWYRKYVGTPLEGGPMPWLYHQYVGHDNNRDWFMLTQKETRALTRAVYHRWFPQIFVDEHQMGSTGPRMFIPPFADPLDPDVHPLIWREINLVGSTMAYRLEKAGKEGLIWGYSFDAYWMGGTRNTGWWKNVTGLLLEVASARIASPLYVDPTELRGGSKGLVEYGPQVNHPNPWKGGWWRLRDIMDYGRIASDALLEVASKYRTDILRGIVTRALAASDPPEPGAAWRIPAAQRDYPSARRLAQLLADHGVDVHEHESGDFWIPLAQPYSRFVAELLEPQRFPEVRLVEGRDILDPYDVSTWTLPLMMGVDAEQATLPSDPGPRLTEKLLDPTTRTPGPAPPASGDWTVLDSRSPEVAHTVNAALDAGARVFLDASRSQWWMSSRESAEARSRASAAGIALSYRGELAGENLHTVSRPHVGIYKPWNPSMDEGWTRWVLEQYGFEPVTIDNAALRAAAVPGSAAASRLAAFHAIIIPDISPRIIATGRNDTAPEQVRDVLPDPYRGGLGSEGASALRHWVESGGTLVSFGAATEWVTSTLALPVRNVLAGVEPDDFRVTGTLLRADLRPGHFVTAGMPERTAVFQDKSIAFQTTGNGGSVERTVLASYPEDSRELLLSGWIRGEDKLQRRAAAVAWEVGRGRAVMFAFRPQHRAQTHATFPLLFHSLWWSRSQPVQEATDE